MGEASEPDDAGPAPSPGHEHDDEEHHGPSIGVAIGLNTVINAVINAAFGYGIAWLHWQDYSLVWYTHALHDVFETDFVAEDLIIQGLSVGIIVTLIVAAILHRQWDGDHLQPGRIERFSLHEERTRGRHMAAWAGVMGFMGAAVGVGISAFTVYGGVEEVTGSAFAIARTLNGFIVGGIAGGLVTASWVTNLTEGKLVPSEGGRTVVARTMARAGRHPLAVLGVVALLTAGLGAGTTELHTSVNETDAMPRGTDHHEAAVEAAEAFNGTRRYSFELHFRTDPDQCRSDNAGNLPMRSPQDVDCANISDEVYVRAMEEAFTFLESHSFEPENEAFKEEIDRIDSPVVGQLGLPTYHKLANWSLAGGMNQAPEDAYALPGVQDRARVNAAERLAWDRLGQAQSATIGAEGQQATVTYHVENGSELSSSQIGAFALEARDAYVDWVPEQGNWDVFGEDNPPLVTADRPVANAHHADTLREDLSTALTFLGVGLLVGLAVVFRDPLAAAIATTMVAIAGAWTFGLMGAAEVPLTELDLVQAPLIVAAGILFTVPTVESFLNHVEAGRDTEEALHRAGDEAGFPVYMGVLVTVVGLTVIGLGPSIMLADAAWVSMFGLASAWLLSITFLPAALSLAGAKGRLLHGAVADKAGELAPSGGAVRGVAAVLLVGLTLASVAGISGLDAEGWSQPVETWPEDDERRDEHEQAVLGFHELPAEAEGYADNALVVRGDPTDPATLGYLEALSSELDNQARDNELLETRTSRDLPSAIQDWLEVCCGAQSLAGSPLADAAGDQGVDQTDPYPQSREEVEQTFEQMYDSPYATVARPLLPGPEGSTVLQTVQIRSGDQATVQDAWDSVTAAVEATSSQEPESVETTLAGPAATSYLVGEELMDWLYYMVAASVSTAAVFALAYTRSVRGGLALTLAVGLASLWLLGLVSVLDVGFGLPLVLGLSVVTLASAIFGTRLLWPRDEPAAAVASGRPGLFSLLVLGSLFAGLGTVVEASAGFPNTLAQDAIVTAVAGLGTAYAASLLVGRALVPSAAEETEASRVVEAEEEPSSPA